MDRDPNRRRILGAAGAAVAVGAAASALAAPTENAAAKKTKIIGVCCSPRKGRSTAASLKVCLDAAAEIEGVETELIELAGLAIPGQVAAGVKLAPGEKDDFPALAPRLSDAKVGGIIVATPVYFGNMTSLCKSLIDRFIVFRRTFALSNKVAGVIAVGGSRNGGQEMTIRSVQTSLFAQEMVLVGDGRPTAHCGATVWSGGKKNVTDDEFGMSTTRNLGRRVAKLALRLA